MFVCFVPKHPCLWIYIHNADSSNEEKLPHKKISILVGIKIFALLVMILKSVELGPKILVYLAHLQFFTEDVGAFVRPSAQRNSVWRRSKRHLRALMNRHVSRPFSRTNDKLVQVFHKFLLFSTLKIYSFFLFFSITRITFVKLTRQPLFFYHPICR